MTIIKTKDLEHKFQYHVEGKPVDLVLEALVQSGFPTELRSYVTSVHMTTDHGVDMAHVKFYIPDVKGGILCNPKQGALEASMSLCMNA